MSPSTPESGDDGLTPRRWLADLAAREQRLLHLAILAGLVAGGATIVQMGLLAWIVSALLVQNVSPGGLVWAFVAAMGAIGVRALAQWGQEVVAQEASLRIRRVARHELLEHLEALGPVRLAGRHSAGLGGQLVEQIEALDGYFARFLPQLRLAVALPLVILAVVAWLDWLVAILLLLSMPLIPLFMALVGMGAERLNQEQFAAVTRLAGHFLDRVRGITTLQLFNCTTSASEEVFARADDYRRRSMRTLRLAFLSSAVLEFFASVAIAVLAVYIGFGLLGYIDFGPSSELTLFSGLTILLLAPEFFQPLRSLSQHYHDRAAALGAADGLVALLNEPLSEDASEGERCGVAPATAVDLRGVSISHPGRGRVLGPIDLEVAAGSTVALVGPSGAGKSSLLQLIAGFIDPHTGRMGIAHENGFAWMDQRPLLIHGTIADNLRLAAPHANDAQLLAALGRAGLGELLARLPEGLDTSLGERGVGLSGGQAQRLALARVFLSPARLVLLDEPTASLDEISEALVIEGLRALAEEGRTLVIATHHPALMTLASQVVRLDQGRIVAEESA
ncbi:thiol reductant ABC exporter subunit CydD [Litchfieldella qijiaojingensis]|uniref:Thiol reductant ABC exporter subunit CydD n=1 Tax=Litchfieldella qijiaojingensis TaxID=980347 RepID=A0ABQ2YEZ6_9GAMM|nr:thiol reductant ABC exporter subunit CydD [Halomonas qijiaojingensis]GGX79951.1 thiol reductant ABC exporter subunit CydD [Halomonas qijiaojingensis]